MDNQTLLIEQELKAPLELVWLAISKKESMKKWYFDIPNFELKVGCIFYFEGGEKEKRYMHKCEILEIVSHKKLSYSWQYEGHSGLSVVSFDLSSIGDKVNIKLTHRGLETFNHPDFSKVNFIKGWKYLIQESLKEYLEEGKELRYW